MAAAMMAEIVRSSGGGGVGGMRRGARISPRKQHGELVVDGDGVRFVFAGEQVSS